VTTLYYLGNFPRRPLESKEPPNTPSQLCWEVNGQLLGAGLVARVKRVQQRRWLLIGSYTRQYNNDGVLDKLHSHRQISGLYIFCQSTDRNIIYARRRDFSYITQINIT